MNPQDFETWLSATLDDRRLSRGERQALAESVAALGPGADRAGLMHRAFEVARETISGPDGRAVLEWLEDVVKALKESGRGHGHGRGVFQPRRGVP